MSRPRPSVYSGPTGKEILMLICLRSLGLLLVAASFLLAPAASAVVTFEWLTVSDVGNACDPLPSIGCFGTVTRPYQISKF